MSWRTGLGALLLVAALLSGWSLLRDRDKAPLPVGDDASKDYVLHDFQIIALDEQGHESTTLRAPLLERTRSDETMTIQTRCSCCPTATATTGNCAATPAGSAPPATSCA